MKTLLGEALRGESVRKALPEEISKESTFAGDVNLPIVLRLRIKTNLLKIICRGMR